MTEEICITFLRSFIDFSLHTLCTNEWREATVWTGILLLKIKSIPKHYKNIKC